MLKLGTMRVARQDGVCAGKALRLFWKHYWPGSLSLGLSECHPNPAHRLTSRLATVLRVMIAQPGLRLPFAPFERRPLRSRQPAQPGQVAAARAGLAKLLRESRTFRTAETTGQEIMHKAPVENREAESNKKANKKQILFSLIFRFCKALIPNGLTAARHVFHTNPHARTGILSPCRRQIRHVQTDGFLGCSQALLRKCGPQVRQPFSTGHDACQASRPSSN